MKSISSNKFVKIFCLIIFELLVNIPAIVFFYFSQDTIEENVSGLIITAFMIVTNVLVFAFILPSISLSKNTEKTVLIFYCALFVIGSAFFIAESFGGIPVLWITWFLNRSSYGLNWVISDICSDSRIVPVILGIIINFFFNFANYYIYRITRRRRIA